MAEGVGFMMNQELNGKDLEIMENSKDEEDRFLIIVMRKVNLVII